MDRRDPAPKARCAYEVLDRSEIDMPPLVCGALVMIETGQFTVVERCVMGHVLRMHPVCQEKLEWYS